MFLAATALVLSAAAVPSANAPELVVEGTHRLSGGDTVVRWAQTHRGLPVLDRGVAVRTNPHGAIVVERKAIEADLPSSIAPALSELQAVASARRFTRFAIPTATAHLVVAPSRRGARLAWLLTPEVPAGLPSSPQIVVDAIDGRVLRVRERAVMDKRARVFVENPVRTPIPRLTNLPIQPTGSTLESDEVHSFNCVDNKSVKSFQFGGPKFSLHVCDLVTSARAGEGGNAPDDFSQTMNDDTTDPASAEDPYSEVSMYFHVTRAYQYFRLLAGDPVAAVVDAKPLVAVANVRLARGFLDGDFTAAADPSVGLEPFSNAFFTPSGDGFGIFYGVTGGSMWFGQGKNRDYAYDGDVVYHEFTHGVVDKTLQLDQWHLDRYGLFDAPGAMNEALADYFSSAITGDPDLGEYASHDIVTTGRPIRTLANGDSCPANILGEVHYDSTLFSGALFSARTSLPEDQRIELDRAIYESMLTHHRQGDLGYEDLARLFLETLAQTFPAGKEALEREMTTRGILPGCTRIVDTHDTVLDAPVDPVGPRGYVAPGTYVVGEEGIAPGVVQIRAPLFEAHPRLRVRFEGRAAPESVFSGGGGGTAFTPVVLVKFDGPITWASKGALTSDADASLDAQVGPSGDYQADFDVPPGASSMYVQIANRGTKDGLYDAVRIAPPVDPVPPKKTVPAAFDGSSGCACRSGSPAGTSNGGLVLVLALGGLTTAVRRRRDRAV
jgi:MYXO-CTERM domain-containing protein